MRLEHVYAEKQEHGARVSALRVEALLGAPAAPEVALGVAPGTGPDDFRVAIRALPGSEAEAEQIRAKVHGEADVRIVAVSTQRLDVPVGARADFGAQAGVPSWFNERRRPLEPGCALSPSRPWVGTLWGFGRRASGALVGLTNAHVGGGIDGVPVGTPVLQPFGGEPIGVTAESVAKVGSRLAADIQAIDLRDVQCLKGYSIAVGNLGRVVSVVPDDLNRSATKAGRTTGVRNFRCTAIDVDNLPIAYGEAGTLYLDDLVEFSAGIGQPAASAGGDSGSLIAWRDGGDVPGILFAGGRDSRGEDLTFAGRASLWLARLDVTLAT